MAIQAKFVVFEGMEGSGKSTQVQLLANFLQARGKKVFVTREPGGTSLGSDLRAILLQTRKDSLDPLAELFLMEAARAQHAKTVLSQAIQVNDLVLCDRYTDSTLAYQGGGRGLDPTLLEILNRYATYGIMPDLTIFLTIPYEVGISRAWSRIQKQKINKEDRFEKEKKEFYQRVHQAYLEQIAKNPSKYWVIDSSESTEKIHTLIQTRILDLLDKPHP